MNPRGGGLVENEEQGKNKKMKWTVVEEQEQEQEQEQEKGSEGESETRFVDLDEDTLHNVLKRVDEFTLGRVACVNKLWRKAASDARLWKPIVIRLWASRGGPQYIDGFSKRIRMLGVCYRRLLLRQAKPPPSTLGLE